MNTDYDNFQLDWMMENDRSIDDIITEIDDRNEYRSMGLANAYKQWIADGGFQDDGIWPSEDEFLYSEYDYTIGDRPTHPTVVPIYCHQDGGVLHLSSKRDHGDATYRKIPNPCINFFKNPDKFPAITSIVVDDEIKLPWNSESMFAGLSKLESIHGMDMIDASDVEKASNMFSNCPSLKNLDGIERWDMSNLRLATTMFAYCKSLTSLDLSGWDTSKLSYTSGMFRSCNSLEALDLSGWNLTNVRAGKNMFRYCNSLTDVRTRGMELASLDFLAVGSLLPRYIHQADDVSDIMDGMPQALKAALTSAAEQNLADANDHEMTIGSAIGMASQYTNQPPSQVGHMGHTSHDPR